ncbi:MAG: methyltransferase domain-containing protein [Candidatus Nanoarchaeia archaeon]
MKHSTFDSNKYDRSSKKFKYTKKKPQINKLELLHNYEKQLNNSTQLISLQRPISKIKYLRFNPTLIEEDKLYELLTSTYRMKLEKMYIPNCYRVLKSHFSISGSFPQLSGLCYEQDITSQIPLFCIDFSKYQHKTITIVDMCSSPGSKLTQLAYFLNTYSISAKIIAVELKQERIKKLINNIQKMNLKHIEIECVDALKLKVKAGSVDIVLLDAPCSGNFILERNWFEKRNSKGVLRNAQIQKQLLEKASTLCKRGGDVLYSTCSMEIEENEKNVIWAQKHLPLISKPILSTIEFTFPYEVRSTHISKNIENKKLIEHSIRLHPPYSNTQGFFITFFEKK